MKKCRRKRNGVTKWHAGRTPAPPARPPPAARRTARRPPSLYPVPGRGTATRQRPSRLRWPPTPAVPPPRSSLAPPGSAAPPPARPWPAGDRRRRRAHQGRPARHPRHLAPGHPRQPCRPDTATPAGPGEPAGPAAAGLPSDGEPAGPPAPGDGGPGQDDPGDQDAGDGTEAGNAQQACDGDSQAGDSAASDGARTTPISASRARPWPASPGSSPALPTTTRAFGYLGWRPAWTRPPARPSASRRAGGSGGAGMPPRAGGQPLGR